MDFFIDFLKNNFENCIWLAIIIVSILPTLESKIAIPLAMNEAIWGSGALSPFAACMISCIGSLLPSFLIIFLAKKFKNKTTGFFTNKFIDKYKNKSFSIESKDTNFKKYLALTGLVAVPLPLTGVWTGSLIAGLTNLDKKYSLLSITIGAVISSFSITILCTIFSNSISYILLISLLIIIIFLFIDIFSSFFKIKKKISTTKKDNLEK